MTLSPNERRLVESVAVLRRELEDRKQRRSTEGPPVVVRSLRGEAGGEAVVADAALSVIPPRVLVEEAVADTDLATETTPNPAFIYDGAALRGYDRGEYGVDPPPDPDLPGFGNSFGSAFG